jgi:hypothetical protein
MWKEGRRQRFVRMVRFYCARKQYCVIPVSRQLKYDLCRDARTSGLQLEQVAFAHDYATVVRDARTIEI